MKKIAFVLKNSIRLLLGLVLVCFLAACKREAYSPQNPVTLTLWHVFGEQADSPMNRLVEEFNETQGRKKGIIINVTLMSSSVKIGKELLRAKAGSPGAQSMPDLFTCYPDIARELGADQLINWEEYFSQEEREEFVPEFIQEGRLEDKLIVFPICKSTRTIFMNGSLFSRFSKATGVTCEDLATWKGFYETAGRFYEWSGGKAFCAFDYPMRNMEMAALEDGAGELFDEQSGWFHMENPVFQRDWKQFLNALVQGHVVVSDLYSNTQVMTGETAAGIGSTAAILYFNDTVTYPDNTSEPMNLMVLPIPSDAGEGNRIITQSGVGLCGLKSGSAKDQAAAEFVHWLTQKKRNLDFCVEAGYMPVYQDAFRGMDRYIYPDEARKSLYDAIQSMKQNAKMIPEHTNPGYSAHVIRVHDALRSHQKDYAARYQAGESKEALVGECWEMIEGIQ